MEKININGVNETIFKHTLDNGLEVYLLPNKNVSNFYITFNTKFGSLYTSFKDELDDDYTNIPNGVAHFLEHITFKMKDGEDASEFFAKLGSNSNAYTSFKQTCYEVFACDHFKENLEELLDFVQTPCYDETMVEAEKGIITEEVKMYEDNPNMSLMFDNFKMLFEKYNYRYLVGGTVEDVNSTTLKNIEDAYNMFYHPSNMFVIITGSFDPDEAINIIKENQSKKSFTNIKHPIIKHIDEPSNVVYEYREETSNVEIPKVNIGIKVPLKDFESLNLSQEELMIYVSILCNCNFGSSSLLKEELSTNNVITDSIGTQRIITDDYLIINILTESPAYVIYNSIMLARLDGNIIEDDTLPVGKILGLEVFEKDLIRKKRVAISNLILSTDDIEEMNYMIQNDIINYGKVINNAYDIYNHLNIDTYREVAKRILNKPKSILVLLPNKE